MTIIQTDVDFVSQVLHWSVVCFLRGSGLDANKCYHGKYLQAG